MRSGIYFFNTSLDGVHTEFFVFSTDMNFDDGHRHLTQLNDELQRFMLTFKEKALPIIQESRLPKRLFKAPTLITADRADHQAKQYVLTYPFDDVPLTLKQFRLLKHLLQGYTIKDVAEAFSISLRTVEKNLELLKIKLDCPDRKTLFAKVLNSNLLPELLR